MFFSGRLRLGVKLQAEAIGQTGKVVENAHNVSNLQAGFIVKTQIT